jgi:glycogen debranching enzyme
MERLAAVAGDDPTVFRKRRERVVAGMLRLMYDEDAAAYYDVQEPGQRRIPIRTATIFFPLAIEELDERIAARLIRTHLEDPAQFASPLPIPSVSISDPAFFRGETQFIWRGPTWAVVNWFLYHALRKRGFDGHAKRLRESLSQAVRKSGFREYYDPVDGTGHGAEDFTWSGLLVDMLE